VFASIPSGEFNFTLPLGGKKLKFLSAFVFFPFIVAPPLLATALYSSSVSRAQIILIVAPPLLATALFFGANGYTHCGTLIL
jgi:hypothetical protein